MDCFITIYDVELRYWRTMPTSFQTYLYMIMACGLFSVTASPSWSVASDRLTVVRCGQSAKARAPDGEQAVRRVQRFQSGALKSAVADANDGFRQYDLADFLVAAKGGLADLLDRKVTA